MLFINIEKFKVKIRFNLQQIFLLQRIGYKILLHTLLESLNFLFKPLIFLLNRIPWFWYFISFLHQLLYLYGQVLRWWIWFQRLYLNQFFLHFFDVLEKLLNLFLLTRHCLAVVIIFHFHLAFTLVTDTFQPLVFLLELCNLLRFFLVSLLFRFKQVLQL